MRGGGAPRGAGADRRTVTCLAIGTLRDAMTRRLAPSDVGRTPFGAPPRHFSDPDRTCALSEATSGLPDFAHVRLDDIETSDVVCLKAVQRVVSHLRLVVAGGVGRGARVRGYKPRPQEPLPAPPAGLPSGRRHRREPGCQDSALRQDCCEGGYAQKFWREFLQWPDLKSTVAGFVSVLVGQATVSQSATCYAPRWSRKSADIV